MKTKSGFISLLIVIFLNAPVQAQFDPYSFIPDNLDWPMWRYDHSRSGYTQLTLPGKPSLLWTRQMEEPLRNWPFQYEDYYTSGNPDRIGKLSYDISYEPVIADGRLFVPSMVSDRITAYSTDTGEELWRYYAGGPVRFAPAYDAGRIYFVSDDGYLYCLNASTGQFIWRFKGSYSDRMVLGNERIISMWPARGGPVIVGGIIYFAAGVMPFEGIFIHALDAISGTPVWTNSTSGTIWSLHQHGGAYSYGGPSPQGYLAVSRNHLIVPGGRTPPAVFDRRTGELLYYNQASGMVGKGAGGYRVFASDSWYFNHGMMYALEDGAQFGHVPGDVITRDAFIGVRESNIVAHNSELKTTEVEIQDRLQRSAIAKQYEIEELWSSGIPDIERLFFMTESYFVASTNGGQKLALIDIQSNGRPGRISWEYETEGEIWSVIAANERIYAVTKEGVIYCFGPDSRSAAMHHEYKPLIADHVSKDIELAGSVTREAGAKGGYALVYGGDNAGLARVLSDGHYKHVVLIEPDQERSAALRLQFDNEGLYGRKIAVMNADPLSFNPIPYIHDLIVVNETIINDGLLEPAFNSLRPYGGTLAITGNDNGPAGQPDASNLVNSTIKTTGGLTFITREGPLPGSAQWTHQYAGPSNRTYSDDELVKPPLGTLWFGGPTNLNVLPRHHNGPIPQVAGGRLVILGIETISARCVYTGRELWVREIPGIGHPFTDLNLEERFFDGNEVYMSNHPGANFIGSPYVSLEERVYVITGDRILSLDASTGEVSGEFGLPVIPGIETNEFGHIMVSGDYIIATADPQVFDEGLPGKENNWNATSSSTLLVMDRHSGKLAWYKRAQKGFRHNAIAAKPGRLFVVDGLSEGVMEILMRRGLTEEMNSELMALDISTGDIIWSLDDNVFGTWLGLYEDKNILLQGGRFGQRRPLADEPNERLTAHNSLTGEILWDINVKYSGPLGLHPEMIISGRPGEPAFDPYTGEFILKDHPLTGEEYRWDWHKYYGCGTMNTSRYLIMFRSGTAGYTDLKDFGGTSNLGGFRAGCTNNMVAADGLMNAPDYTRTCTCSYPLQTSVGLIHMPDAGIEMWTLNRLEKGNKPIRTLGINFGGQGNRREDGVLWLEYPKVYAAGPEIQVKTDPAEPEWFRNHATWIENSNEKYDWVASYGARGLNSVSVELVPDGTNVEKYYNLTLYFTEPDNYIAGGRIFDVYVQGEKVIENLDISKEAGGPARILRKEIKGVKVDRELLIEFSGSEHEAVISGIEIVIDE